jgi:hypothetical protein
MDDSNDEVGNDGLTDAERAEARDRFHATVGAKPTTPHQDQSW